MGKITSKLDQDAGNFNSDHADVCAAGKDNAVTKVEHSFIYKWAMRRFLNKLYLKRI